MAGPWDRRLDHRETVAAGGTVLWSPARLSGAPTVTLRRDVPLSASTLHDSQELIAARMGARKDHFMPPSLLPSQSATPEPLEPDEPGVVVSVVGDVPDVIERAMAAPPCPRESEGAYE